MYPCKRKILLVFVRSNPPCGGAKSGAFSADASFAIRSKRLADAEVKAAPRFVRLPIEDKTVIHTQQEIWRADPQPSPADFRTFVGSKSETLR